jgi:pseudaminic acid cytidylyltransferase
MSNICLIPARGGSKRIRNKNIIDFFGKPLIYWAIIAAKESKLFKDIYVSTDSVKISQIALKYGVKVINRSKKNSSDKASLHSVTQEVIKNLMTKKIRFNNICSILPTAVLVDKKKIKDSFRKFIKKDYHFLISVCKYSSPPQRGLILKKDKLFILNKKNIFKNSQDLENIYHDAALVLWGKAKSFLKYNNTYVGKSGAYVLKESEIQDIDTYEDLKIAKMKFLIKNLKSYSLNIARNFLRKNF